MPFKFLRLFAPKSTKLFHTCPYQESIKIALANTEQLSYDNFYSFEYHGNIYSISVNGLHYKDLYYA